MHFSNIKLKQIGSFLKIADTNLKVFMAQPRDGAVMMDGDGPEYASAWRSGFEYYTRTEIKCVSSTTLVLRYFSGVCQIYEKKNNPQL